MKYLALFGSVLSVGLLVGCDDKKEVPAPPAPAQPSPQVQKSVSDQAKDALQQGKEQVTQAAQQVKAEGSKLADEAKTQVQQTVDQTKTAAADARSAITEKVNAVVAPQPGAATATTTPPAAAVFDYKQKMAEATTYLKEHKVDLADKALVQVEQRKASIPADYHAKIDSLRKMIDSAKASQNTGISLPKF